MPMMSVNTTHLSPSFTRPMAMPAQGFFMGTPASNNANDPPQMLAMDEDPLDSKISDTTRSV
jgi:hypothetical protein